MNPCKHEDCPNKTSHESGYCFKHKDEVWASEHCWFWIVAE